MFDAIWQYFIWICIVINTQQGLPLLSLIQDTFDITVPHHTTHVNVQMKLTRINGQKSAKYMHRRSQCHWDWGRIVQGEWPLASVVRRPPRPIVHTNHQYKHYNWQIISRTPNRNGHNLNNTNHLEGTKNNTANNYLSQVSKVTPLTAAASSNYDPQ